MALVVSDRVSDSLLGAIPGESNQRPNVSLVYHLASRRYRHWSRTFPVAQYTYNDGSGPAQRSGGSVRLAGYRARHRAKHEHSAYRHSLRSIGRRCGRYTPVIAASTKSFSHKYPRAATDVCERLPHRPAGLCRLRRTRHFHRASTWQRNSSKKSTISVAVMSFRFRIVVHMEVRPAGRRTYPRACSEAHLWQRPRAAGATGGSLRA